MLPAQSTLQVSAQPMAFTDSILLVPCRISLSRQRAYLANPKKPDVLKYKKTNLPPPFHKPGQDARKSPWTESP